MLFQIKTINGQKTIVPLTADTGTGAPVGSLIAMYKKSSPSGYLYCDGSTFDETKYPALYQYLGSNVLPDYRECVAVGAEQNTTDTIASHDVYTEGQFKDDQIQDHKHIIFDNDIYGDGQNYFSSRDGTGVERRSLQYVATNNTTIPLVARDIYEAGRHGTTTHGKQKAVFIYIKATSGLTENQQENVLNTINENLSYSTTEHKTGKKWIDGKPIYEKTIIQNLEGTNPFTNRVDVTHGIANIHTPIRIVTAKANSQGQGDNWSMAITIPAKYDNATFAELGQFTPTTVSLFAGTSNWTSFNRLLFVLEYTKTTD